MGGGHISRIQSMTYLCPLTEDQQQQPQKNRCPHPCRTKETIHGSQLEGLHTSQKALHFQLLIAHPTIYDKFSFGLQGIE